MRKRIMSHNANCFFHSKLFLRFYVIATALVSTVLATSAMAGDLAVTSVDLTQGAQFGTTTLVAGRSTMVRVKVALVANTVETSAVAIT